MLEEIIATMKQREGVRFSTMRDAADAFRNRRPS
jgi:hypothetical protein